MSDLVRLIIIFVLIHLIGVGITRLWQARVGFKVARYVANHIDTATVVEDFHMSKHGWTLWELNDPLGLGVVFTGSMIMVGQLTQREWGTLANKEAFVSPEPSYHIIRNALNVQGGTWQEHVRKVNP